MNYDTMPMFETTIENGEEEYDVEVYFDYTPSEDMTRHHPGCDESVDICEVRIADTEIEICLLKDEEELMAERILEHKAEEDAYIYDAQKYGAYWD
jgi:hypothetical protein